MDSAARGRLKIVLTLAREVPYIVMDDPLSGLDPMVRQSIDVAELHESEGLGITEWMKKAYV